MRMHIMVTVLALLLVPFTLLAGGNVEQADAGSSGAEREAVDPSASESAAGARAREADLLAGGIAPVRGFTTDFSRSLVRDDEIISGGPPKDGIPSIDAPRFVDVAGVDWVGDDEPVLVVQAGGETHVYPLQILTYHEIVNYEVGGVPLAVTYCPLCNTGVVFERRFDAQVLDFGTTGRLRYSNLLMYDRQTETWWQQATGRGVVGRYAGARLVLYPSLMLPWDVASRRFAGARVLSRDTGHSRSYGTNPYAGYDSSSSPFLYRGPVVDTQYNPMARVVQVVLEGESLAAPYPVLQEELVIQDRLAGVPVVILWDAGTASALDARAIRDGRDVGSANAFRAVVDGRALTFAPAGETPDADAPDGEGRFTDTETGSLWTASGLAVDGSLEGAQLEPLVGIQHFWFSYSAFAAEE